MAKQDYTQIILIGGLFFGAYFLLKSNVIGQTAQDLGGAIGSAGGGIGAVGTGAGNLLTGAGNLGTGLGNVATGLGNTAAGIGAGVYSIEAGVPPIVSSVASFPEKFGTGTAQGLGNILALPLQLGALIGNTISTPFTGKTTSISYNATAGGFITSTVKIPAATPNVIPSASSSTGLKTSSSFSFNKGVPMSFANPKQNAQNKLLLALHK